MTNKDNSYQNDVNEILISLETTKDGLSSEEAAKRLSKHGHNSLKEPEIESWVKIFLKQFTGFMSIVLIIAGVLAFAFGFIDKEESLINFIESGVIFAILIINGVVSTVQEVNANKTLEALKKISAPTAKVYRDGKITVIAASEIIPGDIVYLDDGAIVPADLRLIESSNLQIQEASLTGESVPVKKDAKWSTTAETLLAERVNMCYSSTIVTYGHGLGVVVATGIKTEIGKIADMLYNEKQPETHIQKTMNKIGKILTIVGALAAVLVLVLGLVANYVITPGAHSDTQKWISPILLAVSLAVAVIPEGLPAMTTILMAMGVKKMAQLNALVKDLPSVETLGSCTCICSDKTGTLTLNKMTVKKVLLVSDIINKHDVELEQITDNYAKYDEIIRSGVLCNTAELNENNGTIGDPTEGALLMLSNDFNMPYAQTKANYKTLFELPFDSDRKRMSTINIVDNKEVLYVKGATDEILDVCESYLDENNNIQKMTTEIKNLIKAKNTELSANALRILSFAKREVDGVEKDSNLENKLIYMGLMGMIDPPRKEVKSAVEKCHAAGIKVIMITGDHAITAKAIATELDIFREGNEIINGDELERMSEQDLIKRIENTTVFSRVSPSGKMRIIKALQANDEITSMTGDGVNDAPSLKAADIGVAMGITGTDVAKSSANVILLDDNFTTIENAVFQGRRIFRNIQKVVQFLVSGSIAEVLIILFTTLLACIPGVSWSNALNPIQILILNLATDTIPCFALGMDALDADAKTKSPKSFRDLFSKEIIKNILIGALWISAVSLVGYILGETLFATNDHSNPGMTMAFLVLSISQIFHAFNVQSNTISIFSKQNQFNKFIPILSFAALLIIILMLVIGVFGGQNAAEVVGIYPITPIAFVIAFALALSIIPFIEGYKFIVRKISK